MPQPFAYGQVIALYPQQHSVKVMLQSGQILGIPVKVGFHGPADGLRINQDELPGRGTWGLIAFPNGMSENAVWLCSLNASMVDALTSNDDQPFTRYKSHWSGYFEVLDDDGKYCQYFPDGTYVVFSDAPTKPTVYRHVVDADQKQQRVEATEAGRNPNTPSPRYVHLDHASGTTAEINPNGDVAVTGNPNAKLTLTFGNTILEIDKDGNMTTTGADGAVFKTIFNGTQIRIDDTGNIHCQGNGIGNTFMQIEFGEGILTIFNNGTAVYNGILFQCNAPAIFTQGLAILQGLASAGLTITGIVNVTGAMNMQAGSTLMNPSSIDLLTHIHHIPGDSDTEGPKTGA